MSVRKLHIPFLLIWLVTVALLVTFSFLVVNHALAGDLENLLEELIQE